MDTVCQACGYQRKPTDQAPDWQCPACGKAYEKTSHESVSPLVVYTDDPTETGMHGGLSYRTKPKESTLNKYGILIGTLYGLFMAFGIPILCDPSSASATLLHSDVGFVSLTFLAIMAVVVVARRWGASVRPDDNQAVWRYAVTLFGLVFAILFFAIAMIGRSDARTEAKIQRNGVRTMADVVRVYSGGCGRHSCSMYVEYAFTPSSETSESPALIHGYADLGDPSNDPRVAYARANKQIPIAYEVGHPDVSALNFNDDVFRLDHGKLFNGTTVFFAKVLVGVFVLVLALVALNLWFRSGKKINAH